MKYQRKSEIVDPLYEPIDMGNDRRLFRKLSPIYFDLLSTFELRRASWLMQSGLLYEVYPGCTHTRRAHAIGCWCIGWLSLEDVKVLVSENGQDVQITLREWLDGRDHGNKKSSRPSLLKPYMCSILLHDVGHPPFSHALEFSPLLGLNHETIGRGLITGQTIEGRNWSSLLKYFLCYFRLRNVPDSILARKVPHRRHYQNAKKRIRTVNDILRKYRVNPLLVTRILGFEEFGIKDQRIAALHKLIDSQVDIDRIDHYLRDSYFSGIRFADYRVRGLLQSLLIVTKSTRLYNKIGAQAPDGHPLLLVREEGLQQVEYLLAAREFIIDKVLWQRENLRLIAALGQGVSQLVKIDPFLRSLLPFLTDQILLQLFREKIFAGTTVEGYERVLRGEILAQAYSECYEFSRHKFETELAGWSQDEISKLALSLDARVEEAKDLESLLKAVVDAWVAYFLKLYEKIEKSNEKMPMDPGILMFTSHRTKVPPKEGWGNVIYERECLPLHQTSAEEPLFQWVSSKNEARKDVFIIWTKKNIDLCQELGIERRLLRLGRIK